MVTSPDRQKDAARNRTAARDVFGQAIRALIGRPTRSVLTAAGVSLGIAAAVATIGVTASAGGAISDKFDALQATQVTLRYGTGVARPPATAVDPVTALHGVTAAGLLCQSQQQASVTNSPDSDAQLQANLFAAQPAALTALGVTRSSGRYFDNGNDARHDAVALLDTVEARQLGLVDATANYTIYINSEAFEIIGMFTAPSEQPRLAGSVVIPYGNCLSQSNGQYSTYQQPEMDILTALGAANQVAQEARLAASPDNPNGLVALVPPDLSTFQHSVEGASRALFLGLAAVSLIIGALGISNTTLISVLERRGEIGLRRAIGATRRAVAAQFLLESALVGLAGGILGTIIGIDVTTSISLVQNWVVVLDPRLPILGAAIGAAVGALAGVYPAWSATRFAPADTLRSP